VRLRRAHVAVDAEIDWAVGGVLEDIRVALPEAAAHGELRAASAARPHADPCRLPVLGQLEMLAGPK
jgi:hypothetical protein